MLPCYLVTVLSCYYIIFLPCCVLPYYRVALLPCYRIIVLPCYRVTVLSCCLVTVLPYYCVALLPCYRFTFLPCYPFTKSQQTVLILSRINLIGNIHCTIISFIEMLFFHIRFFQPSDIFSFTRKVLNASINSVIAVTYPPITGRVLSSWWYLMDRQNYWIDIVTQL